MDYLVMTIWLNLKGSALNPLSVWREPGEYGLEEARSIAQSWAASIDSAWLLGAAVVQDGKVLRDSTFTRVGKRVSSGRLADQLERHLAKHPRPKTLPTHTDETVR